MSPIHLLLSFVYLPNSYLVYCEDIKDLSLNDLIQLNSDTQKLRFGEVQREDITYYSITRSTSKETFTIKSAINKSKPFKFIIHGWIENNRRHWYETITKKFLEKGDFNIIQVDWELPARTAYVSSAANTKMVGRYISEFINQIEIPPGNIHIIGHSLGAHIAGFVGKNIKTRTGKKLKRISGLDPAGPFFRQFRLLPTQRLSRHDADIVDVIHTDSGLYGINFPIGTVDIIVNQGKGPQPGCFESYANITSAGGLIERLFCSHGRSIYYFLEWINTGIFHCKMCHNWVEAVTTGCFKQLSITEEEITSSVQGICVTTTSDHEPFLI